MRARIVLVYRSLGGGRRFLVHSHRDVDVIVQEGVTSIVSPEGRVVRSLEGSILDDGTPGCFEIEWEKPREDTDPDGGFTC